MSSLKFKMLADGYPSFRFPENLLEEVDLSDFCKAEKARLPLFIGTQFGLSPRNVPLEIFEGKKIAILEKSQLSGKQFSITLFEIREGRRVEIQRIPLEKPFWDRKKLKKYEDEPVESRKIEIPEEFLSPICNNLRLIPNGGKSHSLPNVYNNVTSSAYEEFVLFYCQDKNYDWINFLSGGEKDVYMELYIFLYRSRRALYPEVKDLPLPLEKELSLFRNIRNPYKRRSKKYSELPVWEDILVLSDLGLCIYYNNHININSYEAKIVQQEILEEFRQRDFYIQNEHLLTNHANPIMTKDVFGTPVITIYPRVKYRTSKDIAPMEDGEVNPQLIYEHYYGLYNKLTDVQLVDELNKGIGIRYWGMGRAAVIRAIKAQLKSRSIDTSSISDDQSFSLKHCVVLENKQLLRLGELPEKRLRLILRGYLQKCYPEHRSKEVNIITYDLENLQIEISAEKPLFQIPINDLVKKKGEMKSIKRPRQQ